MKSSFNRDEAIQRFQSLLDSAMADEPVPAGVDAELIASLNGEIAGDPARDCDSYSLWSAITALTQEIKLQGRAFQELNATLGGQAAKIGDELRAVHAERERAIQREVELRVRRGVLNGLLDLRDRLARGRETASSYRMPEPGAAPPAQPGWWDRMLGRSAAALPDSNVALEEASKAVEALSRGYELSLERLDQMLVEYNAIEIRCEGEPFDPKKMNAIDSEESDLHEPGTVMEVFRSGYEWNGDVFRTAQVKVAKERARSDQE